MPLRLDSSPSRLTAEDCSLVSCGVDKEYPSKRPLAADFCQRLLSEWVLAMKRMPLRPRPPKAHRFKLNSDTVGSVLAILLGKWLIKTGTSHLELLKSSLNRRIFS